MKYSKQVINNTVLRYMSEGMNNDDILDSFLMMKMSNDFNEEYSLGKKAPSLSDIKKELLGTDVMEEKDYNVKMFGIVNISVTRLSVKISPTCTLNIENVRGALQAKLNEKNRTTMSLQTTKAKDVAMWIIRQKENYENYIKIYSRASHGYLYAIYCSRLWRSG